jgi:hypothetical protein
MPTIHDILHTLAEDDDVEITGTASSPHGRRFEKLRATIATIARKDCPALKVWPHDASLVESGKVWFPIAAIEEIRKL